jgi:hypothetical protein
MPKVKSLTKKQVAALRRALDRSATNMPKVGSCVKFRRKVTVCRDSKGYYVAESPRQRAKKNRASRARRLSPYYQDV